MADNYKAQLKYIEDGLKKNPNDVDLLNSKERIQYRMTGKLGLPNREVIDSASVHANANAARFQGELTPENKAYMEKEYNDRMAAGAKARGEKPPVARRATRDAAKVVGKAVGKAAGKILGIVPQAVFEAVPGPFRNLTPEMKSLQMLQNSAKVI